MCERRVLLRAVSRRWESLTSLLVCSVFSCGASGATGLSGWVWLWEGGEGEMSERWAFKHRSFWICPDSWFVQVLIADDLQPLIKV